MRQYKKITIGSLYLLLLLIIPISCIAYVPDIGLDPIEDYIWGEISMNELEFFKVVGIINGYAIDINTGEISTDFENSSILQIEKNRDVFVFSFELKEETIKFETQDVTGTIFKKNEEEYYIIYNFQNIKDNFFADMTFLKNSGYSTIIFTHCDIQYNYEFTFCEKDLFQPFLPLHFEPTLHVEYSEEELNQSSYERALQSLDQISITKIGNSPQEGSKSSFTYYYYGLSYECYNFFIDYPSELPVDYYPFSAIQVGIYRYYPTEAQIKSDLQTYCRQDYWDHGFSGTIRKVLAFNMVTEDKDSTDAPDYDIYKPFLGYPIHKGTIYPSEIEALWYDEPGGASEFYFIIPSDSICMADHCFSWSEPPSYDPLMGKAWVDYGAYAYVGTWIEVESDTDDEMRIFWEELCQNNNNVLTARNEMVEEHGPDWNGVWNIYGDQYATLQN